MNYEKLGETPLLNEHGIYKVKTGYSKPAVWEAEQAKAFLSKVSAKSNTSMYDHLRDLIERVLRKKIENAVDIVGDLSEEVMKERFQEPTEPATPEIERETSEYVNTLKEFLEEMLTLKKDVNLEVKKPEDDEIPEEKPKKKKGGKGDKKKKEPTPPPVEEKPPEPAIPRPSPAQLYDLELHMLRFRDCGLAFGYEESFMVGLSIKALAKRYNLDSVRFWGKIFGIDCNYYIAEAPFTEGFVIPPSFEENPPVPEPVAEVPPVPVNDKVPEPQDSTIVAEAQEKQDQEAIPEGAVEGQTETPPVVPEQERKPSIPPLPIPQIKPVERYTEKNGEGVNKYMYFVTNNPVSPWVCLPQLNSQHIVDAKKLKKFFTGNLRKRVTGCVAFEGGTEAHLLRAQIARITAATYIAPVGYYRFKQIAVELPPVAPPTKPSKHAAPPEPIIEMRDSEEIEENPEYQPVPVNYMMSLGLDGFVHIRQAILTEGYCKWTQTEVLADGVQTQADAGAKQETASSPAAATEPEKKEEEVQKEPPVPLLKPLSQDQGTEGIDPWMLRNSSILAPESGNVFVKSSSWPGAFTYYDGKNFENVYIGEGYKYTARHYAPTIGEEWQREYPLDEAMIEPDEPYEPTPPISETTSEGTGTDGAMDDISGEMKVGETSGSETKDSDTSAATSTAGSVMASTADTDGESAASSVT